MSSAETITTSPKKTNPKKRSSSKPKKSSSHPTYEAMIKASIIHLKEMKGSSKAAILKYIVQHYKVGNNIKGINAHLRMALKRGVISGFLKQSKGSGASGSFRLGDKTKKPSAVTKVHKPKLKAKKFEGEKMPSSKKVSKIKSKTKKAASPKRSPKKVKSPKKKTEKPKTSKKSPVKKSKGRQSKKTIRT